MDVIVRAGEATVWRFGLYIGTTRVLKLLALLVLVLCWSGFEPFGPTWGHAGHRPRQGVPVSRFSDWPEGRPIRK